MRHVLRGLGWVGTMAVAAAFAVAPAQARTHNWQAMTLQQRATVQLQLVKNDLAYIGRWQRQRWHETQHRDETGALYTTGWIDPAQLALPAPYMVRWHRAHLRWTRREWRETQHAIRVARGLVVPSGYPPHHALWVCIAGFEGGVKSVNPNGHYGMLQMTLNWMKKIRGRASDWPQAVQEWAAETAWAENHYSYSFLYGQWFAYDDADGCYSA